MSKKVTMLKVWYYPNYPASVFGNKHVTLIKPEEFDNFRKSIYGLIKVKRKKVRL